MKYLIVFAVLFLIPGYAGIFSQSLNHSENESAEDVARLYLGNAAKGLSVPSEYVDAGSLKKAKMYMLFGYTGSTSSQTDEMPDDSVIIALKKLAHSNAKNNDDKIMGLPVDSVSNMTPQQVWDYSNYWAGNSNNLNLNIEWNIVGIEYNGDTATVTYFAKDRSQKILKLKKTGDRWRVVLGFGSIF